MQVGGFAGFNGYAGKVGTIDQCFADANVVGASNDRCLLEKLRKEISQTPMHLEASKLTQTRR